MPRVSRATIYRRPNTQNWSIRFYLDGQLKRETTGTPERVVAEAFLRRRLEEASSGRFTDIDQRPTFAEMRERLVANYRFKRNRTDAVRHTIRLAEFFGTMRGEEIVESRIEEYSRLRMEKQGASPATLRRELALLKRMLRLSSHRLPRVPLIDMPRVDNARQGFFEESDFRAIAKELPPHARNLVEFLYLTGLRSSEAFRLVWTDIDWKNECVHLRDSKNREPRIFPFKYHARLEALLRDQREQVSSWNARASGCVRASSTGKEVRSRSCGAHGRTPAGVPGWGPGSFTTFGVLPSGT